MIGKQNIAPPSNNMQQGKKQHEYQMGSMDFAAGE